MNSNDLFSFLDDKRHDEDADTDEDADGDVDESMEVEKGQTASDSRRKRRVEDGDSGPSVNGAEKVNGNAEEDIQMHPAQKKPRMASPNPLVVDEVEIEAKREVAASAGLTGTVEAGSKLELRHQVRHQVAVPPGYNYIPISNHVPPAKPAREYKFTLDPFQQVSVHAIQRNESVLVSAHTSAGKTVVAEYAIAQCLQNKQRVIYTSPIKVRIYFGFFLHNCLNFKQNLQALSNQKYREMAAEFGDVGLMTGDVTINPTATCLVMTTEV